MDGVKSVIIPGESVIFFIPSPCPFPLPVQRLSIFSILAPERAKNLSIGVHGFAENRENRQPLTGRGIWNQTGGGKKERFKRRRASYAKGMLSHLTDSTIRQHR